MLRLLAAAVVGACFAAQSLAQCGSVIRVLPAPRPAAPVAPAKPFIPKSGVAVREEKEPEAKVTQIEKMEPEAKKNPEFPRIPKTRLPDDPEDLNPSNPRLAKPVKEAESKVEQYVVPADEGRKPSAEVRVGFFNHSDKQIILEVNGEEVKLPSEQYVTVRVSRTFSWAEKGQKNKDVVVPPDADGVEIVFRK
jgi:hypothetical protein